MLPSPRIPYIELHVPHAESEQQFLLLAVQAALKTYRAAQRRDSSPQQATCHDTIPLLHRVE